MKLPNKYNLEDMYAVDTYTINEGILVKKAIEMHPDMKKCKLIISNKRGFNGAFIDDGKLSLTGTEKIYILGENLELILKIMKFKISNLQFRIPSNNVRNPSPSPSNSRRYFGQKSGGCGSFALKRNIKARRLPARQISSDCFQFSPKIFLPAAFLKQRGSAQFSGLPKCSPPRHLNSRIERNLLIFLPRIFLPTAN